ncbi:hypothetical protein [Arcanobacterium pinnipediorum]|uniref:Uncharacterized protein n=1 Tax=Arcanobacterium pinnipediorum TaxID=1503041 RepID=A0ABY5AH25_9ACTO|nr:hypothetical protein [Arcanobacterium pinnipediorum]USR78796.1 hypothetical protein NG665_05215 [Arcanobacterium pinnipediorum]
MNSTKLIAVYNAHGGFQGELTYLMGKIMGKTQCALCDITHGLNPLGKSSWKQAASAAPLPLETVHLNEMDARTARVMATTNAPAIIMLSDEADYELVNTAEIEECAKDPQRLLDLINSKINA